MKAIGVICLFLGLAGLAYCMLSSTPSENVFLAAVPLVIGVQVLGCAFAIERS